MSITALTSDSNEEAASEKTLNCLEFLRLGKMKERKMHQLKSGTICKAALLMNYLNKIIKKRSEVLRFCRDAAYIITCLFALLFTQLQLKDRHVNIERCFCPEANRDVIRNRFM